MKKIFLSIFVLGFVLSFANAKGVFVGVETGYQKNSFDHKEAKEKIKQPIATGIKYKDYFSKPAFGIKAGYDFDVFRAYGKFDYMSSQDIKFEAPVDIGGLTFQSTFKFETMQFILGADWTPNIPIDGKSDIKASVGGFIGVNKQETKLMHGLCDARTGKCVGFSSQTSHFKDILGKKETSFLLGFKLGGIYPINQHNEIELNLAYSTNFAKTLKTNKLGAFVGYNYKF